MTAEKLPFDGGPDFKRKPIIPFWFCFYGCLIAIIFFVLVFVHNFPYEETIPETMGQKACLKYTKTKKGLNELKILNVSEFRFCSDKEIKNRFKQLYLGTVK